MKTLLCVACMLATTGKVKDAITVYHGHALCQDHFKQAVRTKERKLW